jgi:hypothetical protein
MTVKIQTLLGILLLAGTTVGIAHSFNWTMMALAAFFLAYLTKGSRRSRKTGSRKQNS